MDFTHLQRRSNLASIGGTAASERGSTVAASGKKSRGRGMDFASGEAALAPEEESAQKTTARGGLGRSNPISGDPRVAQEAPGTGPSAREAVAIAGPSARADSVPLIRQRIAEMQGQGATNVAHFEALALAVAELQGKVAALQELLQGTVVDAYLPMGPPELVAYNDPLIVDLDGDGVEFIAANVRLASQRSMEQVYQDFGQFLPAADQYAIGNQKDIDPKSAGYIDFHAWVGGGDGFLVYDRNKDGQIQAEDLFGDKAVTGRDVANGFEDLALLDANQDGKIDPADPAYQELRVWKDAAELGKVDEGELLPLPAAGIAELNLQYVASTGTPYVGEVGSFTPIGASELKSEIATYEAQLASVQPALTKARALLPLSASLIGGRWFGGKPIVAKLALQGYIAKLQSDLVTALLASHGSAHRSTPATAAERR